MIGKQFSPRIRNIKQQLIYRIDIEKDYKKLTPLVRKRDRIINLDCITDQWDRMGHFYSSLESGHATASTAMKRLAGFSATNHFYRANREFGRVIKTEHILTTLSDPKKRRRTRRGLLKGEQIHQLARDILYAKQGKITAKDLYEQKNTCSCLTLVMSCIIYWQSKEITRVIKECNPELEGINLAMIEHISPIEWENIILYGEYIINRNSVK
jgi:TnpA family transposase